MGRRSTRRSFESDQSTNGPGRWSWIRRSRRSCRHQRRRPKRQRLKPQFHRRQSRHQMLLHKQTRRRSRSRSGGRQLTPDTGTQMVPVNFVSPSTRCRRHGRPAGRDLFRFCRAALFLLDRWADFFCGRGRQRGFRALPLGLRGRASRLWSGIGWARAARFRFGGLIVVLRNRTL